MVSHVAQFNKYVSVVMFCIYCYKTRSKDFAHKRNLMRSQFGLY